MRVTSPCVPVQTWRTLKARVAEGDDARRSTVPIAMS